VPQLCRFDKFRGEMEEARRKWAKKMSASKSQDSAAAGNSTGKDEQGNSQGSGTGAASALERMKADHALRRKHQHGTHTAGPGHEEDPTPER